MSSSFNEIEQIIQNELVTLKRRLSASVLFIEIIRPASQSSDWIAVNTDIFCTGKSANGDDIFEFNFNENLKKAATRFFKIKSIKNGVKLWLTADNVLQFQVLTKASADNERQLMVMELFQKNREQRNLWKNSLSTIPFGTELALAVYNRLSQTPLCHQHRDYCGTGFFIQDKIITYSEVEDGNPTKEFLAKFDSQNQFINWLAQQSDYSLARLDVVEFKQGNQTITRSRLNSFVNDTKTDG